MYLSGLILTFLAFSINTADINSSTDIEQCLKEAAYMKDFHHPNVIQLIGKMTLRSDSLFSPHWQPN